MSNFDSIDVATRNSRLMSLAQTLVDNKITYKLDLIANIQINGLHYFSVFRRYNSVYEIVIEDMRGDVYCHKDYTIRKSLETILCISSHEADNMYTMNAVSYKHNSPISNMTNDIADMRWSEMQKMYYGLNVNFGGILCDFQYSYNNYNMNVNQTCNDVYQSPLPPHLLNPELESELNPELCSEQDINAANTLLTISITDETPRPTLSMLFTDLNRKRKREEICYCRMNSDEDDDVSDQNMNYTVLRNGTRIPKPTY